MASRKKPGKNIKLISSGNSNHAISSKNGSLFRWRSINGISSGSGPPKTATVDQESATQEEVVAAHYEPDLKALDQYESRFVRILDRALKQFNQIREQYPPQLVFENEPKIEIFENEPKIEILKNEPGTEISEEAAVRHPRLRKNCRR